MITTIDVHSNPTVKDIILHEGDFYTIKIECGDTAIALFFESEDKLNSFVTQLARMPITEALRR